MKLRSFEEEIGELCDVCMRCIISCNERQRKAEGKAGRIYYTMVHPHTPQRGKTKKGRKRASNLKFNNCVFPKFTVTQLFAKNSYLCTAMGPLPWELKHA